MIGFIAKDSQPLFPTIENKEAPSFIAENASVFTGKKTDVATYIGPRATTFDTGKADEALIMESQGATPREVWDKTGTFNQVLDTGETPATPKRQEIDDSKATFKTTVFKASGDKDETYKLNLGDIFQDDFSDVGVGQKQYQYEFVKDPGYFEDKVQKKKDAKGKEIAGISHTLESTLVNVLDHPELFKAYPFLKDVKIRIDNPKRERGERTFGYFTPKDKSITINANSFNDLDSMQILGTLIHEVQHNIDEYEDPIDGAKYNRSSQLREILPRSAGERIMLPKDTRKAIPPFNENVDILQKKEDMASQGKLPSYVRNDQQELVDNLFIKLRKYEGASGDKMTDTPTGKLGLTPEAKEDIIKRMKYRNYSQDNNNADINKLEDEEYIAFHIQDTDEVFTEKLPGYSRLDFKTKVNLIDTMYNLGRNGLLNPNQFKKTKEAIKAGDNEQVMFNLLDTASVEGKSAKGIAKRRALNYNEVLGYSSGKPRIISVNQLENGTLQYLGDQDQVIFQYKSSKGRHHKSDVGKVYLYRS